MVLFAHKKVVNAMHRSALVRTLYYLKVKTSFSRRYNYIYPATVTAVIAFSIYIAAPDENIWGSNGIISKLTAFLAVLAPFYIASLAAVATFQGNKDLDLPFPPDHNGRCASLPYIGTGGVAEPQPITQRHFLSLLFGYSTIIAFSLLLLSIAGPIFGNILPKGLLISEIISSFAAVFFCFLFFQIMSITIIAVYYLSDKLQRETQDSGDNILRSD